MLSIAGNTVELVSAVSRLSNFSVFIKMQKKKKKILAVYGNCFLEWYVGE
jgi:hypothetical protein